MVSIFTRESLFVTCKENIFHNYYYQEEKEHPEESCCLIIKFLDIRIPNFTVKRITVRNIIKDYNKSTIFQLQDKRFANRYAIDLANT